MKVCMNCQHRLGPADLSGQETQDMELHRAALDLQGVCFQHYACPGCGHDHVFLEVFPLPRETRQAYDRRRTELAQAVAAVRIDETTVLLVEQGRP